MDEGNHSKTSKCDDEKTTCKTIESISEVHGVCGTADDKNKEGNIPEADVEITEGWDVDGVDAELVVEPERAHGGEDEEPEHLWFDGEAFGFSFDVDVVVDEAEESRGDEREDWKPGFVTVDEGVVDEAEPLEEV